MKVMNLQIFYLTFPFLLLLGACAENTTTDATTDATTAPIASPVENAKLIDFSAVPSGEYQMDKTHGYVSFSYNHLGYSQPVLRYSGFDANVSLDTQRPELSTLNVSIDTRSLDSGVTELNERLMKDDFFDADNHPKITFTSKSIDLKSSSSGTLIGDLTIKGVTKSVSLDAVLNGASPHPRGKVPTFGITATTQLDRSDFNIGYLVPHVGADIEITISAEFNLIAN